jgi:ABC-type spermidine/putrescine transport system permease subunit I
MRRRSELDQDRGDLHLLTLLIGYPMAYAIARLSPAARNVAMMLVVLPTWTSFLIRVYAWKASWTTTACSTSSCSSLACRR